MEPSPAVPCGLSSTWGSSDCGWKVSRHLFHFFFDFNLTNSTPNQNRQKNPSHSRSQQETSLWTKIHWSLADNQHSTLPGIVPEIQLRNAKSKKQKSYEKTFISSPLYTAWFMGILMHVRHTPYISGIKTPCRTQTNQFFVSQNNSEQA